MQKQHYTYLITNLHPCNTKRYYIGVRSVNGDPHNDKYMGSSDILTEEIAQYGIGNFEKVIVAVWPSRDTANQHEIELHKSHNVKSNNLFYNKANAVGNGFCTAGTICGPLTRAHKEKLSKHFTGISRKPLTPAQCNKLSKAMKGKCTGEKNAQFGRCWITFPGLGLLKSIPKESLALYLEQGWIKGAKHIYK